MTCHFCKNDRPLILQGKYEICYNCMVRLEDAAPELLAALEIVWATKQSASYEDLQGGITGYSFYLDEEQCSLIQAAITKAKGETPERGTCLNCGERVPQGCCICGPRRRIG